MRTHKTRWLMARAEFLCVFKYMLMMLREEEKEGVG